MVLEHRTYSIHLHHEASMQVPFDLTDHGLLPPWHSKYNAVPPTKMSLHVHFHGKSLKVHVQYPQSESTPDPDLLVQNVALFM